MELRTVLVALSLLSSAAADEESCVGRCDLDFQLGVKCQCDAVCTFYSSCCRDYHSVCGKTPGDEFLFLDDEFDGDFTNGSDYDSELYWPDWDYEQNETDLLPEPNGTSVYPEPELEPSLEPDPSVVPKPSPRPEPSVEPEPSPQPDPSVEPEPSSQPEPSVEPEPSIKPEPSPRPEPSVEPEPRPQPPNVCTSNKPVDAVTELKNGSIFAFVGKYLYELNDEGVADGYPKLIQEVWEVQGPIDAAFTRINCEGKTYLFKGKFYWRFHDGVMEAGFPRLIKEEFPGIPDSVDAALALPAAGIRGKERVYFFKGRDYWKYVFTNQPSQAECAGASISDPFRRYVQFLLLDWEKDSFTELFGSSGRDGASGPFRIAEDWRGLPARVDSAVIGKRIAISKLISRHRGKRPHGHSGKKSHRHRGRKRYRHSGKRRHRHSGKRGQDSSEEKHRSSDEDHSYIFVPSQSVYFFSGGDSYRVDLLTKRVALARPPYPRSIAKYWFKCKDDFE